MNLPLEIFDSEILLDENTAVLYILRSGDCDPRPLMDILSEQQRVLVALQDLGPAPILSEPEIPPSFGVCGSGCGARGCGSCEHGKCASCKGGHNDELVAPQARDNRISLA
jgi:hypothetical protein